MPNNSTVYAPCPQLARLRDARLVLEINVEGNLFLDPITRHEIRVAKRAAWVVIADVAEQLISTMNVAAGDPDLEDATDLEDEELSPWALRYARSGPGCDVADAGEDEHDREAIDEREPDDGF